MKITNAGSAPRTVALGSLKLGDTFLFDSRMGMIFQWNLKQGTSFGLKILRAPGFLTIPPQCLALMPKSCV